MSEFIDVISPKALEQLKLANAEIVTMIANVKKVNENLIGSTTPSGSDSALKSLTAEYQKQEQAIAKLQKQLERLNQQKSQTNVRTSEEIVNQRALATASDRQARATSQLVGAYANLNAKHQQASINLQNLVARGRLATQTQEQYNKELKVAQREFETLNSRILLADKAVGRFNRNVGNYPSQAVRGLRDLIGAFGIVGGVSLFAVVAKDVFQTTKELQSLNNALKLVTETESNFAEQQQFLQKVAESYGLEIKGLSKLFTQFYVSAKDKLSSEEIQNIFESISKAGSSMGLSVESQERAFLALNQMMSKGVVSAEELRGQLGEALPGAFGIMAKALNVNEQQLGKMMKDGKLLASDVLPKFAKQLEITYGIENVNRIETITAATNRLSNEWTNAIASLTSGGGFNSFLINIINQLGSYIGKVKVFLNELSTQFQLVSLYLKDLFPESLVSSFTSLIDKFSIITSSVNIFKTALELLSYFLYVTIPQGVNTTLGALFKLTKVMKEVATFGFAQTKTFEEIDKATQATNEAIRQLYLTRREKIKQDAENRASEQKNIELQDVVIENENKETKAKREKIQAIKLEGKAINGILPDLRKLIKDYEDLLSVTSNAQTRENIKKNLETLKQGLQDIENPLSSVEESAKKAMEQFSKLFIPTDNDVTKNWKDSFQEWSSVAQDAIQTVQDAQTMQIEKQLYDLERAKNIAILFAGESASAREEIERQYDEKRRQILERQARQDKAYAIVNSIINTAQAVIATLARTPPPAGTPLAIAVGAIGAAQTALIASQQIPQFYKGTDNAPEGWAWTQEKGAEIITDKSGRVKDTGSNGGAKLTYLSKGDKVFTAEQSKNIMFNKELNSILNNNGILPTNVINNKLDLLPLRSDIRSLENTIKNKSELHMISDRQGERVYQKEQGKRALLVSNRLRIK
jgi:tape measure domain-containing protein